jgi:hypothetical protein
MSTIPTQETQATPPSHGDKQPESADAPRWLVISIAALALILAIGLALWMIYAPANAEPPEARFWMCFSVSLSLTLFFWVVLWRQQDLVLLVKMPARISDERVKIGGPIVLFVVLLVLLTLLSPSRETFMATYQVEPPLEGLLFYGTDTKVEYDGPRPRDFSCQLIEGVGDEKGTIKEMLVRFPPDEQTVEMKITHPTYLPKFSVTLNRKDSKINLTGMKRAEPESPPHLQVHRPEPGETITRDYLFGVSSLPYALKKMHGVKDSALGKLLDKPGACSVLWFKAKVQGGRLHEIDVWCCDSPINWEPRPVRKDRPFTPTTDPDDFGRLAGLLTGL